MCKVCQISRNLDLIDEKYPNNVSFVLRSGVRDNEYIHMVQEHNERVIKFLKKEQLKTKKILSDWLCSDVASIIIDYCSVAPKEYIILASSCSGTKWVSEVLHEIVNLKKEHIFFKESDFSREPLITQREYIASIRFAH
jgi:hypothetical protein